MLPDPLSEAHLLLCIQPGKKSVTIEEFSSSAGFTRKITEELRKKKPTHKYRKLHDSLSKETKATYVTSDHTSKHFLNSRNRSSENTTSIQTNNICFPDFSAVEQPIQTTQSFSG